MSLPSWRSAWPPSPGSNSFMQDLAIQHPERAAPIWSAGPTFAHPTIPRRWRYCAALDQLPPAARKLSVDPLLLVPRAGSPRNSGGYSFLLADPVLLIPFRVDIDGCQFFSMGAPPTRSHSFLRWTHFYSIRSIVEEPALHAFDFTRRLTGLPDIEIQEAPQKGGFVFRPVRPTS